MGATVGSIGGMGGYLPPVVEAVRSLYETHPYPRYPLLAKPKWVEGYLTTSLFSQALARHLMGGTCGFPRENDGKTKRGSRILIGGAGEILPYVMRQWEPWSHGITCVDLSSASLRRARFRLALNPKPITWVAADLDQYLVEVVQGRNLSFDHLDVFGVLHHMPSPGRTLDLIARALVPGGTARIMVYNSPARQWIRSLQRLFAVLCVDPQVPADMRWARDFLVIAAQWSPTLGHRMTQMGASTLSNPARFADTFLHPRECSLAISWWWQRIAQAGLRIMGLLDRYGELDDLPNPLWQPPSAEALQVRAEDGRFEGNLELYVQKPGGVQWLRGRQQGPRVPKSSASRRPWAPLRSWAYLSAWRHGPPRAWFGFLETRDLGLRTRWALWQAHLDHVFAARGLGPEGIPPQAFQRLARIGAILPGPWTGGGERRMALAPMVEAMDKPPPQDPTLTPIPEALLNMMAQRLRQRGRYSERAMDALVARLSQVAMTPFDPR